MGCLSAGDFWPYTVYQYDEEIDTYQKLGSVDTWDKALRDVNYDGEAFLADIDKDKDGVIYYLLPADWDGQYAASYLVDGAKWNEWREKYLGSAEKKEIDYKPLTEENIEFFGYPKPEVQEPEPKG